MATGYTSLLKLALPVTGELDGVWGSEVNNSITELVEDSIAATATASVTAGDWTLSTTGGGVANEARCAILVPTGTPGVSRNVIAPSLSKAYIVHNQSDSSVVLKGAATTGITISSGAVVLAAWSGSDFVRVGSAVAGSDTQVQYNSSGALAGSSSFTFASGSGTVTATKFAGALNGTVGATTPSTGVFTQLDVTAQGDLRLQDSSGGEYVAIQAPATISASYTLTLPDTDGSADQVLTTDGSGVLSWTQPIAVGNDYTWTGIETFTNSKFRLLGSSTGYTTFTSANSSASNYTMTVPAENMTVGFKNIPAVGAKTSGYVLAVGDVGKYVEIGSGGAITIPDAVFSAGDAISLFNNTSGNVTITCTITTAYIAGANTDMATMTLASRGLATIFFNSGTVCAVSGNVS